MCKCGHAAVHHVLWTGKCQCGCECTRFDLQMMHAYVPEEPEEPVGEA